MKAALLLVGRIAALSAALTAGSIELLRRDEPTRAQRPVAPTGGEAARIDAEAPFADERAATPLPHERWAELEARLASLERRLAALELPPPRQLDGGDPASESAAVREELAFDARYQAHAFAREHGLADRQ